MIVIGDVHGCYKTLIALLAKLPDDQVCFVGDLIDRGPGSAEVVDLVRKHGYICVLGNHEDMLVSYYKEPSIKAELLWLQNGGNATVESYKTSNKPLDADVDWFDALPVAYKLEKLLVSHSSAAEWWLGGCKDQMVKFMLWDRCEHYRPIPDVFNVFGHTPVKEVLITEHWANVDTGCCFKQHGYGILSALQYPEMKVYQQINIE